MPVLKDFRQTKKISLTKYEESEIVVYNSVLVSEGDKLNALDASNSVKDLIGVLVLFIKSWNFTDEKGIALPVNEKNLGLFSFDDLSELVNKVKEFAESVKKN